MRSRSLNGAISPRPGAAEANERESRPTARIDDALGDEIIGQADELVVEECGGLRGRAAIARLLRQALSDLGAAMFERAAKDRRGLGVSFLPGAGSRDGRQPRGGR